jgi:GxxExxY protein
MPCKNCGKEGHNTSTCQEKKELLPFPLDSGIKEKLMTLADICKEVARTLKKGRVEVVYQAAVCQELQMRHIPFVSEETIQILYKGKFVGIERIDVCIGESFLGSSGFVYEFKATSTDIKPENVWQVISYLNHKGYNYGAVVNFTQNVKGCLEIQFVVRKEGVWYLVDAEKEVGEVMADYCY